MKNLIRVLFSVALVLLASSITWAQVPNAFMIQGLAQDADGNALINQEVEINVLLDGVALDHDAFVTTSSAGVFMLQVTSDDLPGMLLAGSGFLDVTVNGIALSTPLLSVPYAMVANEVVNDQVEDDDSDPTNEIQTLEFADGKLKITGGNEISIPTGNTDADADPTNEFQTLSFENGMLTITDGNTIPIASGEADADADPENELQSLKIIGNTLEIVPFGEGDASVTLPDGNGGGGGESLWSANGQDIFYNDGNVGVGVSEPQDPLHVIGNVRVENGDVTVEDGNNILSELRAGSGGGELLLYDDQGDRVGVFVSNDGFNDPDGPFGYLELSGPNGNKNVVLGFIGNSTEQDRGGVGVYNEGDDSWWLSPDASSDPDLGLYFANGNNLQRVGEFSSTNGQYSALSDRKVKENIGPLVNVMSSIMALNPVSYNYTFDPEKKHDIGFIAQEVKSQFPELVNQLDDDLMGVNYSGFSVLAIRAIQEQQVTIESQQKMIEQLMERVEKLETSNK